MKQDEIISNQESKIQCSINQPQPLSGKYGLNYDSSFFLLLDNLPIFFYILDGGKLGFTNHALREALGYSQDELTTMNCWDLVSPNITEITRKQVTAQQRGESLPDRYELKVFTKYGEELWLDIFYNPLELGQKRIILFGAIDITQRKRAEEELRCSESLFRQLAEQVPVIIYTLRGQKFGYVNPAMRNILGYSQEELLAMNWWDTVAPEAQADVRERSFARQRGESVPDRYEVKVLTKNGEERWADLFHNGLVFEDQKYVIVGGYDITARKYAEQELHKIQEELEDRVEKRTAALHKANEELIRLNRNLNNIFMNMSDGVIVINDQGHIETMNQVLHEAWGGLLDEFKKQLKHIILSNKNIHLSRMFHNNCPFRDIEMMIPAQQGDIHILASGTPINDDHESTHTGIIIVRPIKEVRNLVNRFSGAHAKFEFNDIITNSSPMFDALRIAYTASSALSSVLIQGESGTGKELFAQAIHNSSNRRDEPFVALNCGALPRELVGSELFGYAEGAFTGAKKGGNTGKFELASRGTLFLDEIGDMPLEQQVTLLRVLQEKQLTRIGSDKVVPVDVRIICATNKDLYQEVQKGHFRKDLYYRLNVFMIQVPPLRQRPEDIWLLFNHFLKKYTEILRASSLSVESEVPAYLEKYDWPGNIRELQNVVERLVYSAQGGRIGVEHLPVEIRENIAPLSPDQHNAELLVMQNPKKLKVAHDLVAKAERSEIVELLERFDCNVSKVARYLSISRNTLYIKIKKHNISITRTDNQLS